MLAEVLAQGKDVDSKRPYLELISYNFKIDDPRDRIIFNEKFDINVFQLVGQFLWITQGSFNTLAIKYYAPYSEQFSSDTIRMIGAYGPRLFGIHHMHQIRHVIETLDENETKRRAVASIYLPQFDQHKLSDEVPCTLNLQYLIREKQLHSVIYMRSQNLFRLLPYDVFLFTMLQEYVNAVLTTAHDTTLGEYNHFSGSFHIYEDEIPLIEDVIEDSKTNSFKMEPMPSKDVDLKLQRLNKFETMVRTIVTSYENTSHKVDFNFIIETLEKSFDEKYWKQLALLLTCYGTIVMKDESIMKTLISSLEPNYRYLVELYLQKKEKAESKST